MLQGPLTPLINVFSYHSQSTKSGKGLRRYRHLSVYLYIKPAQTRITRNQGNKTPNKKQIIVIKKLSRLQENIDK